MSLEKSLPCFLLLLAALGLLPGPAAADAGRGSSHFVAAGQAGGRGVATFDADPLVTMTPIPFTLKIQGADGREVRQGEVDCELTMPAMPMPENRPEIAWAGEAYRGEAVFTMAGAWRMTCRTRPLSGFPMTLIFDIPEVRLK